jgi:hypothetical protein
LSSLMRTAESLKSKLRGLGAKTTKPRQRGACVEILLEWGGRVYSVYLYPGRFTEAIVAKLAPAPCGCERALYCPYGLIVVGEEDILPDRIHAKLGRLEAIASMVEEEGINLL